MATSRRKTVTKPIDLIEAQAAELHRLKADSIKAHEILARNIEGEYFALTGGNVSKRELRRLGHPFARSGAKGRRRGRLAKLPINVQTGRLRSSIRRIHMSMKSEQEWRIGFDRAKAGKSVLVLSKAGLKRMVPRGFEQEVRKRGKARHLATKRYLQGRL